MDKKKTFRLDEDSFKRPDIELFDRKQLSFIQRKYRLSPKELRVSELVCKGLDNQEIAKALRIKLGTVKTHLRNVYRRIRVKNKVSLILRFEETLRKKKKGKK